MMFSEDKVSHITHLLLEGIKKDKLARLLVDEIKILREIKGPSHSSYPSNLRSGGEPAEDTRAPSEPR